MSQPEEEIFRIENLKTKGYELIPDQDGLTNNFIVVIDPEQDLKDIKVEFLNTDYLSSLMNNQSYISDLLA